MHSTHSPSRLSARAQWTLRPGSMAEEAKSYAAKKREKKLRQKERAAVGVQLAHGEHAAGTQDEIASRPARAAATAPDAAAAVSSPAESKKRGRVPAGCADNKRGAGSKERQQERRRQKRRAELAEAATLAPAASTLATSQGVPECDPT